MCLFLIIIVSASTFSDFYFFIFFFIFFHLLQNCLLGIISENWFSFLQSIQYIKGFAFILPSIFLSIVAFKLYKNLSNFFQILSLHIKITPKKLCAIPHKTCINNSLQLNDMRNVKSLTCTND